MTSTIVITMVYFILWGSMMLFLMRLQRRQRKHWKALLDHHEKYFKEMQAFFKEVKERKKEIK